MVLVSVVVPVYNVENYLEECLDSILKQSYGNIEVLLVDDGSTDQSGRICDVYAGKDERVKVFHLKNGGVSAARNFGIEQADGDYLLFVDSDDCIHVDLIRIFLEYEKQNLCFCDFTREKEDIFDELPDQMPLETFHRSHFMQVFCANYVNSPVNNLFRTEILKSQQIRFPEDMNLGEDLLFNLEYLKYDKRDFTVVHLPLYYYRPNREGSLSSFYKPGLFDLQIKMFEIVKDFLMAQDLWTEENQKLYYGVYWDRLFLTVRMCRDYEKEHAADSEQSYMLTHPIWKDVKMECLRRKVMTPKRRLKDLILKQYQLGI